jgi:multidrug efflux pump subunit AcrB
MVVNFQSWMDPFIILLRSRRLADPLGAVPTRTTISVPLMGCIMAIGVATSNSILM